MQGMAPKVHPALHSPISSAALVDSITLRIDDGKAFAISRNTTDRKASEFVE